ncbi:PIG-L family deacetylase [Brachybacterium sp. YJGR34]|uniref:PIG-L family deacetylase n=1 Tax=Brachybacterium sp. YJGR34 TaxID=2059911 RepID=UPI000E0A3AF1|nr:PIG-L family deacetylase [Brachybacterium sp. YJGR34]
MTGDPWQLLGRARTVLAVHAHPDDESLSSGALLAELSAAGTRVELVTATRGEEGEIVPGAVDPGDPRPLEEIREAEIDAASAALGLAARHWLGTAPALAADAAPRDYRDSGMQWVRPGLAGPSDGAGPDSFTRRPLEDAVADLAALIAQVRPDVVLGYDDEGTYGHPDHVRAHEVTAAACARTGTPRIEVASSDGADGGFVRRDHPETRAAVRRAIGAYRTQLTVLEDVPGGIAIRHVGGQDDVVALRTGLRRRE